MAYGLFLTNQQHFYSISSVFVQIRYPLKIASFNNFIDTKYCLVYLINNKVITFPTIFAYFEKQTANNFNGIFTSPKNLSFGENKCLECKNL